MLVLQGSKQRGRKTPRSHLFPVSVDLGLGPRYKTEALKIEMLAVISKEVMMTGL